MEIEDSDDQSTNRSLTEQIVRQVAEHEGVSPIDLETPLYKVLDVEALEELFQTQEDGTRRTGCITFSYLGYEVTIEDMDVQVQPIEEESSGVESVHDSFECDE